MCLSVKGKPVVRYNKRERVFYKVLQMSNNPRGPWGAGLHSPYFGAKVELGVENVIPEKMIPADDFTWTEDIVYIPAFPWTPEKHVKYDIDGKRMMRTSTGTYTIGWGCFHLFKKKEDAEREASRLNKDSKFRWGCTQEFKVYKAIVPAGTAYVNGKYNETDCVAVKKVIYEEI